MLILIGFLVVVIILLVIYWLLINNQVKKTVSSFEFENTYYVNFPHIPTQEYVDKALFQDLLKLKENGELKSLSVKNLRKIQKEYKETGVINKEWIS